MIQMKLGPAFIVTLILVIITAIMLIQTNTSRAEIITFKNGFSINTDRPFDQQIEKTLSIIGPLKAKEFIAGLSGILFQNEAAVNNCVIQNTPNSPGLISAFMTKACDLAASLVTQFCQIQAISDEHKDLCNNIVVIHYLNQRQLSGKQQNQLAWILFNMDSVYPTNRNKNMTARVL
jgi:hypothetical protein